MALPNLTPMITGPCCACGEERPLDTIIMLNLKAPTPGTGWGCFACHLPQDGAIVLLCGKCGESAADPELRIMTVCAGYPYERGRLPIEQITEPFKHDDRFHPEKWVCGVCGCTRVNPCLDHAGLWTARVRLDCDRPTWPAPYLCSDCMDKVSNAARTCLSGRGRRSH